MNALSFINIRIIKTGLIRKTNQYIIQTKIKIILDFIHTLFKNNLNYTKYYFYPFKFLYVPKACVFYT